MSLKPERFSRSIILKPDDLAFDGIHGELKVGLTSKSLEAFLDGASRTIITADQVQALTNKTIDADLNSVLNIENENIKDAAAIDATKIADGSVDNAKFQALSTVTGNVQSQIDSEIARATAAETAIQTNLTAHIDDVTDAHDASAISVAAVTNLTATDAQAAFAEHQSDIDTLTTRIGTEESVRNATDLYLENIIGQEEAARIAGDNTNATNLTNHINDTVEAHKASAISLIPNPDISSTDVQDAVDQLTGLSKLAYTTATNANQATTNHLLDTEDAHDASAISTTAITGVTGENVQAVLGNLKTQIDTKASTTDLNNHVTDTTDAHTASAITNVPSGNLAATTVQGALNELQSDVDTRATAAALTAHTSATSAHGVTGAIVGTTDTQTLTNKTIQGASFQNPTRSDVKKDTFDNLAVYASTATNGQIVFATDTKQMFQVLDGGLEPIGGGSTDTLDNFVTLGDGTRNTHKTIEFDVDSNTSNKPAIRYNVVADMFEYTNDGVVWNAFGSGSGGGTTDVNVLEVETFDDANFATFPYAVDSAYVDDSSPLNGFASAVINHIGSTGGHISKTIGVPVKFWGKDMTFQVDVSSIATHGNVLLDIYDEDGAAYIVQGEPLEVKEVGVVGTKKTYVSFRMPQTDTITWTIRGLQDANGGTTTIDDVVLFENVYPRLTDQTVSFDVPKVTRQTYAASQNVNSTVNAVVKYSSPYQTGSGLLSYNSSTGVWTALKPCKVDVAFSMRAFNTTGGVPVIRKNSVDTMATQIHSNYAGSWSEVSDSLILSVGETFDTFIWATVSDIQRVSVIAESIGEVESREVTIPMTMSGIIEEEDFSLYCAGNAGQVITVNSTKVPFNVSSISGDAASWSGDQLTILKDGVYSISTSIRFTTVLARRVNLYIDGVFSKPLGEVITDALHHGELTQKFTAGQVLSFVISGNGGTLENVPTSHYLSITHQGSLKQVNVNPNQKATIETAEVRLEGATTRGTTATGVVKFDTLARLTGSALEVTSTTADGTYITVKKKGTLTIGASAYFQASTVFIITKNQATLTSGIVPPASQCLATEYTNGVNDTFSVSATEEVVPNDVIRIYSRDAAPFSSTTNILKLNWKSNEVAVSVSNTLPQFSESDLVVKAAGNSGQAVTGNTTDIPFTASYDPKGQWSGTQFRVKETGIHNIKIATYFNAAINAVLNLYVNGALYRRISNATTDLVHNATISDNFNEGDLISVRSTTGGTLQSSAIEAYHHFIVTKVGKPNVTGIDVTPFVRVPMPTSQSSYISQTTSIASGTNVTGALTSSKGSGLFSYNSTTGVYTALKPANIQISLSASTSASSFTEVAILLGTVVLGVTQSQPYVGYWASTSADFSVLPGDTFVARISSGATSSGQRVSVTATGTENSVVAENKAITYTGQLSANQTFGASTQDSPVHLVNLNAGVNVGGAWDATNKYFVVPEDGDYEIKAAAYTNTFGSVGAIVRLGYSINNSSAFTRSQSIGTSTGNMQLFFNVAWSARLVKGQIIRFMVGGSSAGQLETDGRFNDFSITKRHTAALNVASMETVAVRAASSTGQSIPTSSQTLITWDASETYDTHGAFNPTSGTFTCPKGQSGYYQVRANLLFGSATWAANTNAWMNFYKNGSVVPNGSHMGRFIAPSGFSEFAPVWVSDTIYLAEGDTLHVRAYHTAGSNRALITDASWNGLRIEKV